MEKKIVPTFINFGGSGIGAILVGFLLLGAGPLLAAETVKKECPLKKIGSLEKRGVVNFVTTPAEFVYTFEGEKKEHPKAWPITYAPRLFTNMMIRWGSSVNDILVLPWCAKTGDTTPLTRRFELPDYVWEKE